MLRRGFLKALFGGAVAAPVAAQAVEPKAKPVKYKCVPCRDTGFLHMELVEGPGVHGGLRS